MGKSITVTVDISGERLSRFESYRAGRKLATRKHCQYATAIYELLDSALSGETPTKSDTSLESILARLDRLERTKGICGGIVET